MTSDDQRRAGRRRSRGPGQCLRTFLREHGALRGQEGLRRRRLRRLHGAASTARRCTPASTRPYRADGPRGHHGRRARHRRRPAPGAAGVRRRRRLPVRLLHGRHGRHRARRSSRRTRRATTCRALLKGNLCRCTGYRSIRDAIAGGATPSTRSPAGTRRRARCRAPAGAADRHRHRAVHARRRRRPACCTSRCCGSPHAHARIVVDRHRRGRWPLPGVRAGAHPRRRPPTRCSPPPGTRAASTTPTTPACSTTVVRFRGQRVAAVVAETARRPPSGRCRPDRGRVRGAARRLRPRGGAAPGRAAAARRQGRRTARIAEPGAQRRRRSCTARSATSTPALAARRTRVSAAPGGPSGSRTRRWRPTAPAAGSTRTAGWCCAPAPRCRSWSATSSRTSARARPPRRVRVLTGRVGGGFGGKQEMLTEDLVALAVLRTGRPVQLRVHPRPRSSPSRPCRHPMRVAVELGRRRRRHADRDAARRAQRHRRLRQPRRRRACSTAASESVALYRCPNKRVDAEAVYTNNLPVGRVPRVRPRPGDLRVESAMDELARELGIDPFELRRRNVVVPGDPLRGHRRRRDERPGHRQLRPGPVPRPGRRRRWPRAATTVPRRPGTGWSARAWRVAMIATIAAARPLRRGHRHACAPTAGTSRRRHHRVRQRHHHRAHARSSPTALGTDGRPDRHPAVRHRRGRLRHRRLRLGRHRRRRQGAAPRPRCSCAARSCRGRRAARPPERRACAPGRDGVPAPASGVLADRDRRAPARADRPRAPRRHARGRWRSTCTAFRVAVDPATGEVRILQSVQAADAGTVMNPEQLRGQVEGGVGAGASAPRCTRRSARRRRAA